MKTEQKYTFGETDRAAERLARLADLFEPSLIDFLVRSGYAASPRRDVRVALDLGSGPGHTTRTLARHVEGADVVGLDRSARFIELARAREAQRASFVVHDVTELPFPTAPADLAFSRFLLTHLAEPHVVLREWARVLRPGGQLLLQETAEMSSENETLGRYYELVARMQAHYGQEMHIGRRLAELVDGVVFRVVDFRITTLSLPAARLAELHRMNLETWRSDPFASTAFDAAELDALSVELGHIAEGRRLAVVRHALGELVLERRVAD